MSENENSTEDGQFEEDSTAPKGEYSLHEHLSKELEKNARLKASLRRQHKLTKSERSKLSEAEKKIKELEKKLGVKVEVPEEGASSSSETPPPGAPAGAEVVKKGRGFFIWGLMPWNIFD